MSSSGPSGSPVRFRSTRRYNACCRQLVKNVLKSMKEEKRRKRHCFMLNRALDRAAYALGTSTRCIRNLVNDSEDIRRDPLEPEHRERGLMMDDDDLMLVRPAFVALVLEKQVVTLNSLLARLKFDNPGWKCGRTTLYKALTTRLGISFDKRHHGCYERLKEDPENIQRRAKYLKYYFQYDLEGREFTFMDESWLNKYMASKLVWTDGKPDCETAIPSGKGERWIIIGAGSKDGWIPNTWVMWRGSKAAKSKDYHREMDGAVFKDWFKSRLLPQLPRKACVVIDRAPYHTLLTEESKGAKQMWNREMLARWIVSHNGKSDTGEILTLEQLLGEEARDGPPQQRRRGWSKQAMWALAQDMRPKPQYLVHRWCEEFNRTHSADIKVLLLPVAHPILNPVELMWSQIKRFVRDRNTGTLNMAQIRDLAEQRMRQQGADAWTASFRHMLRYATDQWKADEEVLEASAEDERQPTNEVEVEEHGSDEEEESPLDEEERTFETAGPCAAAGRRQKKRPREYSDDENDTAPPAATSLVSAASLSDSCDAPEIDKECSETDIAHEGPLRAAGKRICRPNSRFAEE